MGRDVLQSITSRIYRDFNPLSPHGERRTGRGHWRVDDKFQSTLPAWGETGYMLFPASLTVHISIHSPRMGRDIPALILVLCYTYFNPLSPHGERPELKAKLIKMREISIHSPRMGRDQGTKMYTGALNYFNPLSPHGERRLSS